MKKYMFFSLVLIIMLSTGCISKDLLVFDDIKKNEEKTDTITTESEVEGGVVSVKNIEPYDIDEKEFLFNRQDGKEIKLKYLQISGLSNIDMETRVNEILKTELTQWINEDSEWFERFQLEVTLNSPRYLSVCYTANWDNSNENEYMEMETRIGITIDILKGRRVHLNDLFENENILKDKLENYEYESEFSRPLDSGEAERLIYEASLSVKDYFDEISQTDPLVYEFTKSYLNKKPTFYMLEDTVVITRDENVIRDIHLSINKELD